MKRIVDAGKWLWDFVVGDVLLVAGTSAAIILTAALNTVKPGWVFLGVLFFLVIIIFLALSLWREVRAGGAERKADATRLD